MSKVLEFKKKETQQEEKPELKQEYVSDFDFESIKKKNEEIKNKRQKERSQANKGVLASYKIKT